jgi:leader peptidase (prepilin peptidase) / N-methyltransferase
MTVLLTAIFGACIGSFLNVCICRIPLNKSIIYPRSYCPFCNTPIPFYLNIPIISYIILRGKCFFCSAAIPFQYFIVEALTAYLAVLNFFKFGICATALIYFIFTASLIVIIFIDINKRIIPDVISISGIILGFISSFFFKDISYKDSIFGIITGISILLFISMIYKLIAKKDGMGMGDVKLLGMIGAFTGIKGVFFTLFAASISGSFYALLMLVFKKEKNMKIRGLQIPFAPFLAGSCILNIFYGDILIKWYFNLL